MTDFFISYTKTDQAWAEWIGWVLEETGYLVTVQAWDFRAGTNFASAMHRAAQEADRTLAILSPDYLLSDFAESEWTAAFVQDPKGALGKLFPVRVREVSPVGILKPIVYTDLVGLDETAARFRLLVAAELQRAKPLTKPIFPGPRRAVPFPDSTSDQQPALPVDDIPEPGPLPERSRILFAVNRLFVGRQDDLRTLARQLKAKETSAIGQVEIAGVTGLGGIGKTQLASEFVHRYGRYFEGGVFWMSFADPAAVPAEVAACGRSLDLNPSYDTLPLDQQVLLVGEEWQKPVARLLVFDNCEDEHLLDRWRPKTGGARVLVTSRRARWDLALGVQIVSLTILPRPASIELLRRFRPDLRADDPALNEIAEDLGDLPLALHLAGSFLQRYANSPIGKPAAYLAALRRKGLLDHPSLQGKDSPISPTGHAAHVARTFALSFEQLDSEDDTDALALALLARAAYFACGEPIPRDLLLKTAGSGAEDLDDTRPDDALNRLTALGLLESNEEGALVVHRLVASFARNAGGGDEAQAAVEETLLEEAIHLNNAGVPGPLFAWQAHLRAVAEGAWEREDTTTAGLANELGFHLRIIGDYPGARFYYIRALAIREKALGMEHSDTAQSLNNLGALLTSQGDLSGARLYYEKALAVGEKILGPEHPNTARILTNLGSVLHRQGHLAEARPHLDRALAICEKTLALEHPNTAISLNNLGGLLYSQGDFAGARSYYERALTIREKVLGSEHPGTSLSLNNLGGLLESQGDFEGARSYYDRALAIREKILGPEHPDTANSLSNLGGLLQHQGHFAEARPYFERALTILEVRLGQDHPKTKSARENLAALSFPPGDSPPDSEGSTQ